MPSDAGPTTKTGSATLFAPISTLGSPLMTSTPFQVPSKLGAAKSLAPSASQPSSEIVESSEAAPPPSESLALEDQKELEHVDKSKYDLIQEQCRAEGFRGLLQRWGLAGPTLPDPTYYTGGSFLVQGKVSESLGIPKRGTEAFEHVYHEKIMLKPMPVALIWRLGHKATGGGRIQNPNWSQPQITLPSSPMPKEYHYPSRPWYWLKVVKIVHRSLLVGIAAGSYFAYRKYFADDPLPDFIFPPPESCATRYVRIKNAVRSITI